MDGLLNGKLLGFGLGVCDRIAVGAIVGKLDFCNDGRNDGLEVGAAVESLWRFRPRFSYCFIVVSIGR